MRVSVAFLACLALVVPPVSAQQEGRPVVTVGVVFDGTDGSAEGTMLLSRRDELLETVVAETRALTRRDFDVRFPDEKMIAADWTVAGIRRVVDGMLVDPAVDVVLSLGPFATNELTRRGDLPKPVVAAWALDVEAQLLPFENGASGVDNLNYLVTRGSIIRDLRKFSEVTPLGRVHIVVDERFLEMIPEVPEVVVAAANNVGLEIAIVPGDESAEAILSALPGDTEGVYLTPLLRMSDRELDRLIVGLSDRRIPSFSFFGQEEVERGILAGIRPATEVPRLGRRIALSLQRILLGENAGTLPVMLDQPERLMINMRTARAIDVYPRWRVLVEAVQIEPEALDEGKILAFDQAVREAVEANLSLRAFDRAVAAGAENEKLARAAFRPRLETFARGVQIDDDRASASLGSQAERTGTAGLSLTQLVYSDGALTNVAVAGDLQRSLEQQRETARLDVALETSVAYLNVLRAETLERVRRDNLRLTESNLDLARRREEIGASGPADVYRWESQLALDRSAVIKASNDILSARALVNRLLHRPVEQRFSTEPPGLEEPWLVTCCERILPYVDDPARYALFREFSVGEGLVNSVELKALDAAIEAQRRVLTGARRAYWAPEIAVQGSFERDVLRSGAGTDPIALPPTFPLDLTGADRNDWSVSLVGSLPLWSGGARPARVRQAGEELARLRVERAALEESIELRIRLAMFEAGSSFPAIELTREAAEAARKNLDLVADAYSRGALSIIDLLDAQNAALGAEALAANAVYDFLIDLMGIQRACNNFDFFVSDEGRDAWFDRLRAFFEGAGVSALPGGN